MTDRRGFFGKLLGAALAPLLGKGAGGADGPWARSVYGSGVSTLGPYTRALIAQTRGEIVAHHDVHVEIGPAEVDPDIEPIPDAERTVGPACRIFRAEESIGFTDDVVPGGYIQGPDSEAKMTSFDPEAVSDVGRLEVYQGTTPAEPDFYLDRAAPCPPPRFAGPWAETHAYIADIYGTRHAPL